MILQATGLVKHYGDHVALRGLDLAVDAGEVFCLLGANGAGKTKGGGVRATSHIEALKGRLQLKGAGSPRV